MLLVRTGGIFGVLITLIVAGIFMFVVRPAINDTTDRAFDTADRALDRGLAADRRHPRRRSQQATDDVGTGDYLSAASFGAVVRQIEHRSSATTRELLDLTVIRAGRRQRQVPHGRPRRRASPGARATTASSPSR